ncbi:vacuolar amino acid permease [Salix suchowensis]|nr:vacuolar amino acid permease [Salix suchowensis]
MTRSPRSPSAESTRLLEDSPPSYHSIDDSDDEPITPLPNIPGAISFGFSPDYGVLSSWVLSTVGCTTPSSLNHPDGWFFTGTVVATLLTDIGSDFNKLNQSSYIGTSYLLSVCCFTPLYGRLSDIMGRKGAMLLGLSLFGMLRRSLLRCSCPHIRRLGHYILWPRPSMESLIAARAVAGMGGGGEYRSSAGNSERTGSREASTHRFLGLFDAGWDGWLPTLGSEPQIYGRAALVQPFDMGTPRGQSNMGHHVHLCREMLGSIPGHATTFGDPTNTIGRVHCKPANQYIRVLYALQSTLGELNGPSSKPMRTNPHAAVLFYCQARVGNELRCTHSYLPLVSVLIILPFLKASTYYPIQSVAWAYRSSRPVKRQRFRWVVTIIPFCHFGSLLNFQ